MKPSKVPIKDTDGLQAATQQVKSALSALQAAGAPQDLVTRLVSAVQVRSVHLVLARKSLRDSELYPYFPESYEAESDAYDDVAQLVAASTLGTPDCAECGHPKAEHSEGDCALCGYLFSGSILRQHTYMPQED
jgi:hypothetical protein